METDVRASNRLCSAIESVSCEKKKQHAKHIYEAVYPVCRGLFQASYISRTAGGLSQASYIIYYMGGYCKPVMKNELPEKVLGIP